MRLVLIMLIVSCGLVGLASNRPLPVAYSPLLELADHTPVTSIAYREDGKAELVTPQHRVLLFEGLRRLEIDTALYWMNGPLVYLEEEWQVPTADLQFMLIPLLKPRQRMRDIPDLLIVLDPGHGGEDPGAVAEEGLLEKDVVLDVALRLQHMLIANNVPTRLTRHDDTFLPLETRSQLAKEWGASLFISIHANSATVPFASGIESFILPAPGFPATGASGFPDDVITLPGNTFDEANLLLADALHRPLIAATGAVDRGIKRERFAVLREAPCPAVLIELGFLSNRSDRAKLATKEYRMLLAEAILTGILSHIPVMTGPGAP